MAGKAPSPAIPRALPKTAAIAVRVMTRFMFMPHLTRPDAPAAGHSLGRPCRRQAVSHKRAQHARPGRLAQPRMRAKLRHCGHDRIVYLLDLLIAMNRQKMLAVVGQHSP